MRQKKHRDRNELPKGKTAGSAARVCMCVCEVGGPRREKKNLRIKLKGRDNSRRVHLGGMRGWVQVAEAVREAGGAAVRGAGAGQYHGCPLTRPRPPRRAHVTAAVLMVMSAHVSLLFLERWSLRGPLRILER